ncbi:MAG: recombinase family protein, partial [Bacilli bacterium]|nr:recombinase family protein [Bacilli bacterium]
IVNQKEMLSSFVDGNKDMIVFDYYTDDGYTGTNFNRPGFKQMFNDVINGNVNAILVKDLSRLGRNYLEVGKYIEEIFPIYNLRIISINDNVDSFLNPDSIRGLMVPMKNLVNETYSKDISEKVISTFEIMAKNGKFIAGTSPYGYTFDSNDKHHLVIDEKEAEIVRIIFDMALKGDGRIKITKYLNDNGILCRREIKRRKKYNLSMEPFEVESKYLWGTTTIGRMLKSEVYIGNLEQLKTCKMNFKSRDIISKEKEEWIKFERAHDSIIPTIVFNKVQKNIKRNTYKKRKPNHYSIYNGKLKCADCGRAMMRQDDYRGNRKVSNYFCSRFLRTKAGCKSHKIKTSTLESIVLEANQLQVKLVIELERSLKKLYFKNNRNLLENEFKNNVRVAEIKIENLKNEKKKIYEAWKFNDIEKNEYLMESKLIEEKINKLLDEIDLYTSTYQENIKKIRKDDFWIGHYKRNRKIKNVTKEILDELIECIYVYEDGSLKIVFKYQDEYERLIEYLKNEGVIKEWQDINLAYI